VQTGSFTRATGVALLILFSSATALQAQYASRGVVMPFTVSGGLLVSQRPVAARYDAHRIVPGFRAVLYPGLKINSSWFVQSTYEVHSTPFLYYEDSYDVNTVKSSVEQLFLGYSRNGEDSAVGLKVGKLNTAFGSFPLRYSDTVNPLLDEPFAFAYATKLRPDQYPCGSLDLAHQITYPVYVDHYCGGSTSLREGMIPVTLYGLPGAEVNVSWHRIDSRFQLTNSSPSNPQSLRSDSQHPQWTAGAGYTIRQGFRVGVSGFQGPFLDIDVRQLLNAGTTERDYPAKAVGTDVQWASGRWSANGEWQRVEFRYPAFRVPPSVSSGYAELKATLNPRVYAAIRAGMETHSRVEDNNGVQVDRFLPNRQSYEVAAGYRLNRLQTLKIGYEWLKTDGVSGTQNNVFGVRLVTSVRSLSKSF